MRAQTHAGLKNEQLEWARKDRRGRFDYVWRNGSTLDAITIAVEDGGRTSVCSWALTLGSSSANGSCAWQSGAPAFIFSNAITRFDSPSQFLVTEFVGAIDEAGASGECFTQRSVLPQAGPPFVGGNYGLRHPRRTDGTICLSPVGLPLAVESWDPNGYHVSFATTQVRGPPSDSQVLPLRDIDAAVPSDQQVKFEDASIDSLRMPDLAVLAPFAAS